MKSDDGVDLLDLTNNSILKIHNNDYPYSRGIFVEKVTSQVIRVHTNVTYDLAL